MKVLMLGLVANGKRSIKSGAEYDSFFDLKQVQGNELLLSDGDVYDTLKHMHKIVQRTLSQTKKISKQLEGTSREATCRNIWNFLYNNIQYKKDNPLREQLRTPVRSWHDRKSGIDCDCYSIFAASILTNLGIPYAFRMAAYSDDFQHVYVVVPTKGNISTERSSYIVIDPVVDRFNYEQPFSKKHDNKMGRSSLNGTDKCTPINIHTIRRFVPTASVFENGLIPTREFLEANEIPYQQIVNDDNGGMFVINTKNGRMNVPTIITPQQSEQIKLIALKSWCACPDNNKPDTKPVTPTPSAKKFPWLWIALGGAALLMLTNDSQPQPVESGLDGVKKKKKRMKPKADKLPVVRL